MLKKSLFAISVFLLCFLCACNDAETRTQRIIIHYLTYPSLISDTFSRALWNSAVSFRAINKERRLLYFTAKNELNRSELLRLMTVDTNNIVFADCKDGEVCDFDGIRGRIDGRCAFRIPCSNLKIDTAKMFSCKYPLGDFKISFSELMEVNNVSTRYNTRSAVSVKEIVGEDSYYINFGSYISLKDKDKISKRLAERLTENLSTNELKAQALLDYITTQIDYSYEDYWFNSEVVKRAYETLLSGDGDCSSKTVLYASLLEQCDIPYCLLYYDGHVNVGVKGDFPNINGYAKTVKGTQYAVAEATIDGFTIGETVFDNDEMIADLLYY